MINLKKEHFKKIIQRLENIIDEDYNKTKKDDTPTQLKALEIQNAFESVVTVIEKYDLGGCNCDLCKVGRDIN